MDESPPCSQAAPVLFLVARNRNEESGELSTKRLCLLSQITSLFIGQDPIVCPLFKRDIFKEEENASPHFDQIFYNVHVGDRCDVSPSYCQRAAKKDSLGTHLFHDALETLVNARASTFICFAFVTFDADDGNDVSLFLELPHHGIIDERAIRYEWENN